MSLSDDLTAQRQFEIDSRAENHTALVEEKKETLEEEARQQLYARMGNTLADFQTWPSWTVEDGNDPHIHLYTLTMKVVFKP